MNDIYDIMFAKFQAKEITEAEWREFCDSVMDDIMNNNRDVFVRLKHR